MPAPDTSAARDDAVPVDDSPRARRVVSATRERLSRRRLLGRGAAWLGGACAAGVSGLLTACGAPGSATGAPRPTSVPAGGPSPRAELFEISLAEWSLHRALQSGALEHLDFPRVAAERFGVRAIETVNSFYKDKVTDFDYLRRFDRACREHGVRHLLIMIDGEGQLADPDPAARRDALERHHRWVAAAAFLGCHSIRVNAGGGSDRQIAARDAADSLRRLARFAEPYGVSVLVENHGGLSSDGAWLAGVLAAAEHPGVGSLPDFGNFRLDDGSEYDRYLGVEQMLPFAKAVSAKSHDFDAQGAETHTDYRRMLRLVLAAGYRGHVGIEYEGASPDEDAGIRATRDLLLRVRDELAPEFR
jgi:sugar phosphate isomerase/epimerase